MENHFVTPKGMLPPVASLPSQACQAHHNSNPARSLLSIARVDFVARVQFRHGLTKTPGIEKIVTELKPEL